MGLWLAIKVVKMYFEHVGPLIMPATYSRGQWNMGRDPAAIIMVNAYCQFNEIWNHRRLKPLFMSVWDSLAEAMVRGRSTPNALAPGHGLGPGLSKQ